MLVLPSAAVPPERVSGVFLVASQGGRLLVIRNERGWDLPGGHVEPGETLDAALRREVMEEACATFGDAEPYATLAAAPDAARVMLLYRSSGYELHSWHPAPDSFERGEMDPAGFVARYHGDRALMRRILELAARPDTSRS